MTCGLNQQNLDCPHPAKGDGEPMCHDHAQLAGMMSRNIRAERRTMAKVAYRLAAVSAFVPAKAWRMIRGER